jgi:DNA-binding NarL/FixJ family response regulator
MKIVILDDHPLIIQLLENEIGQILPSAIIKSFTSIEPAANYIESNNIDFAICDLQIVSGKSLIIPTTCMERKIPYMVFSSHANKITIDKLRALKVLVYVSKAAETKEISQGLLALFNNQEYYCSTIGAFFEGDLQTLPTEPILATTMQTKILMLLKEGFSQTEVANKLCLEERTIYNHLAILRDKNDCRTTSELVRRFSFWN